MNNKISIIGCGWLGLPLAKFLIQKGFLIKGSTTSPSKLEILAEAGIVPFQIEIASKEIKGDIEACLSGSELLILNIPPGLRKNPEANFIGQLKMLLPFIENSSIKKLIFISSTSVYADDVSMPTITEFDLPAPDSDSGKQLLEAENLLKSNRHFETAILRFSGLFGKDRHPAYFLSGKKDLKNPNAPVNLIHQEDAINIIYKLIELKIYKETFNVSTTPHPSKINYYSAICSSFNLPAPRFDEMTPSKGKSIDSGKLVNQLNYQFIHKL